MKTEKKQTHPQCLCLSSQALGAHLHHWVGAEGDPDFVLANCREPQRCITLKLQWGHQDGLVAWVHTEVEIKEVLSGLEQNIQRETNQFRVLPAQAPEGEAQATVWVQTEGDLAGGVELTLEFDGAAQGTGGSMRHLEKMTHHTMIIWQRTLNFHGSVVWFMYAWMPQENNQTD